MSTHSTVQPVRPEPGSIWPSSHLTAEQEIRARAVEIAVRRAATIDPAKVSPAMTVFDIANEIAAYIRDGVKPERTPRPPPPPAPPAPGLTRSTS